MGKKKQFQGDLKAHGRAMRVFRNITLGVGFVLWAGTVIFVAVFAKYENEPFAFNAVGLWSVIAMTATLCMNFYMTAQARRYSAHFAQSGKEIEETKEQHLDIIRSLCSNFSAVYYLDTETGELKFLQIGRRIQHYMGKEYSEPHPYEWYVERYCEKIVLPEYREEFIKELARDNLREKLSTRDYYTYTYLGDKNGRPNYFEMKVTKCDNMETKLVLGFADVDAEVREKAEKNMLLKDALSQAERANKTKDVFLSNVSHELLTPLNEISGRASVIAMSEGTGSEIVDQAELIVNASERMAFLVNDILDISMIENGEMILRDEEMNIKALISEACEHTAESAKSKNISVVFNHSIKNDKVIGDGARFYSIVKRLEDFSVDFSKEGSTVTVDATELSSIGNRARFKININSDNMQVTEEEISGMYDTFFKEPEASGESVSATGTGLLISKIIIEMMKGKLEIKAHGEKGTGISVTLGFIKAGALED